MYMAERSPSFLRIREGRRPAALRNPPIGIAALGDPMSLWLIPIGNDDKGGLYNETQEEIIEWIAFASSMFGILTPVTNIPLLNTMKGLALAQGRVLSAMMIAEDYLDGEYDFSIMLDKMSGVAEDAIDDTGIIQAPDLFSVVEGFGYEDRKQFSIPPEIMSFDRCEYRVASGNWRTKEYKMRQCIKEKGHSGRHEF